MGTSRFFGSGQFGKELPRPEWTVALLCIFGPLVWCIGIAGVVAVFLESPEKGSVGFWLVLAAALVGSLAAGVLAIGLALIVKYAFSVAVSVKLMERSLRDEVRKEGEAYPSPSALGGASHEEVVSLLSEIMENTLLDDSEKAAKCQLAKKHRQQALRREIQALIKAGKYSEAHERLEEFRLRYADTKQVGEMESQLSEALRHHEESEIAGITEQVQRYVGLGLWDRAMESAHSLASQFPENPEAARLPETIRLEQEAGRRQEQQRLYREIEHLVSRKHWRQALRAAETLVENHPSSPEANRLRGQMDELRRNAAIAERREWETRIAEHVQTGRHREAYDLAVELMEKYPDSPQAEEIRKRIDQLKARAGL